jgi:hypothetical protein
MYTGVFKEVMTKASRLMNYAERNNDQVSLDYYKALWNITDYCIKTQDKENYPKYAATILAEYDLKN